MQLKVKLKVAIIYNCNEYTLRYCNLYVMFMLLEPIPLHQEPIHYLRNLCTISGTYALYPSKHVSDVWLSLMICSRQFFRKRSHSSPYRVTTKFIIRKLFSRFSLSQRSWPNCRYIITRIIC